jgi:hypothetical protein
MKIPLRRLGNRFCALYDLSNGCVRKRRGKRVHSNKRAPGADGIAIQQIVMSDEGSGFLERIQPSLRMKTYQPQAVQRAYISKVNGSGGRWEYRRCAIGWYSWRPC